MGGFRRFIISMANGFAVAAVIGVTLFSAIFMAISFSQYGRLTGTSGYGALGFLLGGVIGFIVSGMSAALFFILSEIATNTRNTALLLQAQIKGEQNAVNGEPEKPVSLPSLDDDEPSKPEVTAVYFQKGRYLALLRDGRLVVFDPQTRFSTYSSAEEYRAKAADRDAWDEIADPSLRQRFVDGVEAYLAQG